MARRFGQLRAPRPLRGSRPSAAEMLVGHGPRLLVDVTRDDATVRLAVRGELDIGTAAAFRTWVEHAEASGATTIVVDLRAVTFLDSGGIGELIAANERAAAAGRRLVLVRGPRTPVAQILSVTAVDRRLETADVPAAVDAAP